MTSNPGASNRSRNLAIAYATQRRSRPKKMAHGGSTSPTVSTDSKGKPEQLDSEGARQVQAEGQRMNLGGMYDPRGGSNEDMARVQAKASKDALYAKGGKVTCPACMSQGGMCSMHTVHEEAAAPGRYSMGGEAPHPLEPSADYAESDKASKVALLSEGGDVTARTKHELVEADENALRTPGQNVIGPVHGNDSMDLPSQGTATEDGESTLARFKKTPLKYARGGSVVEEIMRTRGHASADEDQSDPQDFSHTQHSEAPSDGPSQDNWMQEGNDYSNYHSRPDAAHGDIPADIDDSVVGQILKDRRSKRRGM